MNTILNQWINNLWRHGAIDTDVRDELKDSLNFRRDDFATVATVMNRYMRYMTPAYQKRWSALVAKEFPQVAT